MCFDEINRSQSVRAYGVERFERLKIERESEKLQIKQNTHTQRDIHDAWAGVTKDAINMEGWEPVDEEPDSYEEIGNRWDETDDGWDETDGEIEWYNYCNY